MNSRPTTVTEHTPSAHRRYRDWTHERIRREAARIGPDADTIIDVILRSRPHPEQGFRSAIGILRLLIKPLPTGGTKSSDIKTLPSLQWKQRTMALDEIPPPFCACARRDQGRKARS